MAIKEKLSKFLESAITWGAVGVLVGAIGPFIPPRWGFIVTFAFLVMALLKTNFFEGGSWAKHILGNLILSIVLGTALLGVWHILPKPKEPPTADEIADAVIRKTGSVAKSPAKTDAREKKSLFGRSSPSATEIAEELAKTLPHEKKPCRVGNGQLVDCTDADLLEWGKPLLERLSAAVQAGNNAIARRLTQYARDHNEAARNDKLGERIELNRYLERDYKNFVTYRAALVSKLKGGDPTGYDPVHYLAMANVRVADGNLGLSDGDSNLHHAELILRDFQELSKQLGEQAGHK